MPTILSDAWGGVYIQIVVVLLVFALGIPALVMQIKMPPDVQRVALRRPADGMLLISVIMCFYVFIAASFMWILHPVDDTTRSPLDWAAAEVTTGMLILTVLVWWRQLRLDVREQMIVYLERKAFRSASQSRTEVDHHLADLIYLGERGETGPEKLAAISSLTKVGYAIVASPKYSGSELRQVVSGFELIAMSAGQVCSDSEFGRIRNALQQLRVRILARNVTDCPDEGAITRALGRLGKHSAVSRSVETALMFVQTLDHAPEMLFELGVAAVTHQRPLLAIGAFRKLLNQSIRDSDDHGLALLGLAAHYWRSSQSARELVKRDVASAFTNDTTLLAESISSATRFYRETGQFETADLLTQMACEWLPSVRKRKAKQSPDS